MPLTAEAERNAMDLTAAMAAQEIAEDLDIAEDEALALLLSTDAGARLYDPSLKLWCDGPSSLAAEVLRESARA